MDCELLWNKFDIIIVVTRPPQVPIRLCTFRQIKIYGVIGKVLPIQIIPGLRRCPMRRQSGRGFTAICRLVCFPFAIIQAIIECLYTLSLFVFYRKIFNEQFFKWLKNRNSRCEFCVFRHTSSLIHSMRDWLQRLRATRPSPATGTERAPAPPTPPPACAHPATSAPAARSQWEMCSWEGLSVSKL